MYIFIHIYFFIEKIQNKYIIGISLERRLMVGQEILVLFIMVRIRALQPKIKTPLAGIFLFLYGAFSALGHTTQLVSLGRSEAK